MVAIGPGNPEADPRSRRRESVAPIEISETEISVFRDVASRTSRQPERGIDGPEGGDRAAQGYGW